MSLHVLADHMASKGRNGDSMLVHMTPGEVAGLHALAIKHGGQLTINPETGLPEANFLKKLLPMLAGAALNFFVPGLGAAVGGAFGLGAAAGTGIAVGGLTTLATGSLSRGLMAGLGAYGGAGLTEGLMGAGAQEIAATTAPVAENVAGASVPPIEQVNPSNFTMSNADKLSTGIQGLGTEAGRASALANMGGTSGALKLAGAAASPIMADAMVPTTTKMPTTLSGPAYIRQKLYDPYTQTYKSLAPVEADKWGSRNFSDAYTNPQTGEIATLQPRAPSNMATGGIVALAAGGDYTTVREDGSVDYAAPTTSPAVMSAADAQKLIEAQYATIGRSGVGTGANQIDEAGLNAWTNALVSGEFKPEDLSSRFGTAVKDYMAQNPDDQYTSYVKDWRAQQAGTGTGTGTATTGGVSTLDTTGGGTAAATDTSGIATLNNTGAATGTTGTNLNAFSNAYTGANINDYIANNNLDAAGIAAAAKQFNVDPAQITAAQNAQNIVTNVYRNVLGRDPDPAGLSWWTNQIMNGDRTGQEMYQEFLKSAKGILGSRGTGEIGNWNLTLDEAAKEYGGYKSAEARGIADEWVRNTLGREVTDADRQQQWYKDAMNSGVMNTVGKAEDIYSKFKNFAYENAGATVAKQIADAKALLSSKGLTEADVLKQTGKTIAELVGSGMNLEADLFKASQLRKPGEKVGFDFSTITKPKLANTFAGSTAVDRTVTNPYGNETNPGDLTYNTDGTVTVQPNIPYRPYGGFSGMGEVKDAYTRGGGSLGYTSPVVKTAAEHEARYNRLTGDSQAAYNYLMGKGANPVQSVAASSPTGIMRPYMTGGMKYTPKFLKTNPDGTVSSSTTNPNAPKSGTTPSAQSINVTTPSGAVVTAMLGSDGVYRTSDGAKYDVTGQPIVAEAAGGGLMGYAVGGGLGTLGGYSDGGRLLKGPGDGVSDSIPATIGNKQQPARLADGEFVVPARIVSELGNGSTDAGAKKLYAMMDRVQKARGKTTGKNKVAANTRADKYLPA